MYTQKFIEYSLPSEAGIDASDTALGFLASSTFLTRDFVMAPRCLPFEGNNMFNQE